MKVPITVMTIEINWTSLYKSSSPRETLGKGILPFTIRPPITAKKREIMLERRPVNASIRRQVSPCPAILFQPVNIFISIHVKIAVPTPDILKATITVKKTRSNIPIIYGWRGIRSACFHFTFHFLLFAVDSKKL